MKKVNILASLIAAVSFVFANVVFTSCSQQTNLDEPEIVEKVKTEYVNKPVDHIIDNTVIWDGEHILYNGATALTARVTPDSLTLTKPAAEHKAATITDFLGDNRWKDSNGNGFSGSLQKYEKEGLTLAAVLSPADPFSKLTPIHPKVSMVEGDFRLQGYAELTESGKRENFDLHVENGRYFLCDTSVTVRTITDTQYEIQYKDTTEYIHIDKDLVIVNGYGFGTINYTVGQKSFSFRVDLDSTLIHRTESEWGVAKLSDQNAKGFTLSDLQKGKYTIKENGISLKSVDFVGTAANFSKLNETFKYGTATVKVVVSYTDEAGEKVTREFTVGGSYLHELKAGATPAVIVPEVTVNHTYDVDSTHTAVYQDGKLIGVKVKFTIKRDGETISKGQYLEWETGLATGTVTGTQVGGNEMLSPTVAPSEEYKVEGWWGEEPFKGGILTAYSLQFHFRTAFKAVPGFGQSKQSVAETNLVFCKRSFDFTDAENPEWEGVHWTMTGDLSVNITEDRVGNDEVAKAEVNGRGLPYEYIGTHYLSFDQYVGGVKVTSQHRAENLLFPKN